MRPYNSPVDWGYANLCTNESINYNCISVFPQIIGVSRPTGVMAKNSDISDGGDIGDEGDTSSTIREARSHHVVYSTRLNMERLLRGSKVFRSQFPEITGADKHLEEIGAAVGHCEVLPERDSPDSNIERRGAIM